MIRFASAALLGVLSLSACAQAPQAPQAASADPAKDPSRPGAGERQGEDAGTPEGRVRAALLALDPSIEPTYIGAAMFSGFREVLVGGQTLYVSDDGRYLLQATPFDIQARQFTLSPTLLEHRRKLLAQAPKSDRIVFAPANPVHTISVFTDVECGYCRKLHQEIGELNAQGIAVEYLAYPRMGLGSQDYKDMVSVWCSDDKRQALTEAKAGKRVSARDCKNPVTMQYDLGQQLGVTGTPAIFDAAGNQLGGYLPPQQLRQALDRLAGGRSGGAD